MCEILYRVGGLENSSSKEGWHCCINKKKGEIMKPKYLCFALGLLLSANSSFAGGGSLNTYLCSSKTLDVFFQFLGEPLPYPAYMYIGKQIWVTHQGKTVLYQMTQVAAEPKSPKNIDEDWFQMESVKLDESFGKITPSWFTPEGHTLSIEKDGKLKVAKDLDCEAI